MPHPLFWSAVIAAAVSVGFAARDLPAHFSGQSGFPPPNATAGAETPSDYSTDSILSLSPFGRLVRETPQATGETPLGLTLRGVVIAAGAPSKAIIAETSGLAQSYGVGDEVTTGTTLAEISGDHVVLDTGGRRETLAFPVTGVIQSGPEEQSAQRTEPEVSSPAPDGTPATSTEAIASWHDRAREDPYAALNSLGLAIEPAGYAVTKNVSEELSSVGFVAGDLVTKVNGQQVGSIQSDLDVFDAALASGHATLEVIRNGQPLLMSFSLR